MKAAILTIGDEINIGQIINTNAAWIAQQCTRNGVAVTLHSTVGDEDAVMLSELERLYSASDVVLITGGLGPTHDDRTKAVLTEFFRDELVEDQETLAFITDLMGRRKVVLSPRQKEQAMVPSKAKVLANKHGTAPGMLFEHEDKIVVSMPGVPVEMKTMMTQFVLPFLQEKSVNDNVNMYRTLLTHGIAEGTLADVIGWPQDFLNGGSLAYLPSVQGVRIRIGVQAPNRTEGERQLNAIEQEVQSRAAKYIFGRDDDSLASAVGRLLKEQDLCLAVAESCTGGLLGGALTDIPGSSEWFPGGVISYSNAVKQAQLGVQAQTLERFGAVSEQTACEMAVGVRNLMGSDLSLSITGVAGPGGGSETKPVGTVWIALAGQDTVQARSFLFMRDRRVNRERSVAAALGMLLRHLKGVHH